MNEWYVNEYGVIYKKIEGKKFLVYSETEEEQIYIYINSPTFNETPQQIKKQFLKQTNNNKQ